MSQTRVLTAIVLVNFVSIMGFGLMFPIFAVYGEQIGASATQIAWAIAAFSLGQLISGPVWGHLSDKFGRRPILFISLLIGAALYVANAFAVTPTLLILARFASGVASGSFSVAFAVASDVSTRENRTRIMGYVAGGFSFGIIFGPAIGGFAAGPTPGEFAFARICFVGAGLFVLAALVTLLWLPETRQPSTASAPAEKPKILLLLRQPAFVIPVFLGLAGTTAIAMMEGVFVLFADSVLGLDPLGIGLMFGAMGIIGVGAQVGATGPIAKHLGEHRMLVLSLVLLAIGLFLLGSSTTVLVALFAMLLLSGGYSLLNPAVSSLASFAAAATVQGAALGVVQAASALGRVVGPAAAGPVYDVQGPAAPFFWGGGLVFLVAIAAVLWRPAVNRNAPHTKIKESPS